MQPTYTPPIPVIGNHPAGCSCSTCEGGRKRLLASPFVKSLIAQLTTTHEQLYKATSTMPIFAPELEKRVLELTDELATAKEDNRVIKSALDESRKISQERERQLEGVQKQLRGAEQKLSHFTNRATAAEAFLDTVKAALDCKDPAKLAEKAQKLQGDLGEEKRLHNLSKMSDANARGILQRIRDEIGGDPDEPALAKVVRLAEALRLAEQGRDKALTEKNAMGGQYEAEFARATGHMQARTKLEEELCKSRRSETLLQEQMTAMEQVIERQSKQLQQARIEAKALVEAAQEQGMIRRAQFTVAGLIVSLVAGAAMYFVGRWAR